jgi:hypothetical protein
MENNEHQVYIIPAVFVKYREDGNVLLKCLVDGKIENRAFQPNLIAGVKNPKYLLLGITTGDGYMQLNVCDGMEFDDLFKTKWKSLDL